MPSTSSALEHYVCACCSSILDDNAGFCHKCQTPVSLSQSVAIQGGGHTFISVLGASNAGKTVYLGLLLDILSSGTEEFRGTAASSFSVDLQEYVVTELEKRSFPEKTPSEADSWQWLHSKVSMTDKKGTRTADLVSPDFAGEAIAMEMSRPGLYPAVAHVVRRSSGILILCDSVRVRDQGAGEDLFAVKLATYIAENHEMYGDSFKRQGKGPSVAVVFTKCDACPEAMDDPAAFAANNAPRLHDFCQQTFRRIEFFAAGIAGCTGVLADCRGWQTRVPLHIQPHGVLEPLRWILASRG
ncbi:MAG: hypothetical protein KDB22_01780 [Planctomycetales bacterium]|nr:hypothetical protein [Planctomycetales bacterium]